MCEIKVNFQGSPAKAGAEKPKVAPKPRGGAPPPPPPSAPAGGPPPPPPGGVPAPKQDDGIDTSALFASINQGSQITAGECLTSSKSLFRSKTRFQILSQKFIHFWVIFRLQPRFLEVLTAETVKTLTRYI